MFFALFSRTMVSVNHPTGTRSERKPLYFRCRTFLPRMTMVSVSARLLRAVISDIKEKKV